MKKNVFMRAALLLLVLTLITSCFVGGTFAKYVTSMDKAQESARVAEWGVTVTASGATAFAEKYNNAADANGTKVISEEKVVAPGTEGTLYTLNITGAPEVMVDIEVSATLELDGWEIDGSEYCPIEFVINGKTYSTLGTPSETRLISDDVEDLIADVTAVINALSGEDIAPNTTLDRSISVAWKWAFEGNDDEKDTDLGNLYVNGDAPTIKLAVTASVTQVD